MRSGRPDVSADSVARAAELIWTAWQTGRRMGELPPDCRPGDVLAGMAMQDALEVIAGPSYGWKLAATSPAGQAHIAVDGPLAGRLFDRFRYEDGDVLPSDDLHMRVAEAEFAFVFDRDLDAVPGRRFTLDEVLAAVRVMHLAIEVPDSRFTRFETVGAAQLVADDACAGRFVLGRPVRGWADLDLSSYPTALQINGAVVAKGSGGNVLGDPRVALHWLANQLPRLGRRLRAGEVVTTGTTTVPEPIGPGDEVVAQFGELGTVRLGFAR